MKKKNQAKKTPVTGKHIVVFYPKTWEKFLVVSGLGSSSPPDVPDTDKPLPYSSRNRGIG